MENIPENPYLSKEVIENIRIRLDNDRHTIKDLQNLDYWVNAITLNTKHYILDSMVENYVYGYEEYFRQKNHPFLQRNRAIDGTIKGTILGVISSLNRFLDGDY